jgi:hypothetical protein
VILLISASWVTRITCVSHQSPLFSYATWMGWLTQRIPNVPRRHIERTSLQNNEKTEINHCSLTDKPVIKNSWGAEMQTGSGAPVWGAGGKGSSPSWWRTWCCFWSAKAVRVCSSLRGHGVFLGAHLSILLHGCLPWFSEITFHNCVGKDPTCLACACAWRESGSGGMGESGSGGMREWGCGALSAPSLPLGPHAGR